MIKGFYFCIMIGYGNIKTGNAFRLCILFIITFIGYTHILAHDFEKDGIYYNINDDQVSVSVTYKGSNAIDYTEYIGSVSIPPSVIYDGKTYDITTIGRYAFYGCTSLTSLNIPNSVTSIMNYAFGNCSGLTSINLPDNIVTIEEKCFQGCSGLLTLNIPSNVTAISNYAFSGCHNLTSLLLPDGVSSIGTGAFYECSGIVSINIPDNILTIEDNCFSGCSSLTSINLHQNITSIGNGAFHGCCGLSSISIPDEVVHIGAGAFSGCSLLSSFVFPSKVTIIEDEVLRGCKGLTSIKLNDYVESIGERAFESCFKLNSINLPEGLITIGTCAFGFCKEITSIDLPQTLTSIGDYAFNGVGISSIIIPNSVSYIGVGAFSGCNYLSQVEIGENVSPIRSQVFEYCWRIENVISHILDPLNMPKNAFVDNVYEKAKLIVPDGTMNKYLSCDGWKDFVNIVEESQQESFMLTVTANRGGEVSFEGQTVRDGSERLNVKRNQSITLTITPDEENFIQSVTVNGEDITEDLYENTYTLAQIKENKNVTVTFAEQAIYLSIQQAEGGSVMQRVEKGKQYEYSFAPMSGWRIHSVTFNDEDVTRQLGNNNTFFTPVIEGNSTLIVVYERTNGQATAIHSEGDPKVQIQGTSFGVRVMNVDMNDVIQVFTTDGKLIKSVVANANDTNIPLERGQVYIIKVREKVVKVRL